MSDVTFEPHPEIALRPELFDPAIHKACYRSNYQAVEKNISEGHVDRQRAYRYMILTDLFFIVQFIMKIPGANRPFIVNRCNEVQDGPDGWCLDLWSRYHYKSTIKTKARTIQRILKYPDRCTMIASYARKAAKKFVNPIMYELENNEILKMCFPEVLYADPRKESPKWSENEGIVVKRKSSSRSEATVEAHGIKEGMPIGSHFDWILLDDLETKDDVRNPDVIQKGRDAVDLCLFLRTEHGSVDVTGTPYSHTGIYIPHVIEKVRGNGQPRYLYRPYPGTDDGTKDGKPVMVTQEEMDDIYVELAKDAGGEYNFNCQVLIDPTPKGTQQLNSTLLQNIEPKDIPVNLIKFMLIDPAGDDAENKSKGDDWAIWIIGVSPEVDAQGIRKRYILDGFLDVLTESAAPELIGRLYMRNGPIQQSGYEYHNVTPAWIQNLCDFVNRQGGTLHQDPKMNMIVRLKDGGRQKIGRIVSAWSRPLNFNSYYISSDVPDLYNRKLREEMDKLGFWPDNGLDAGAYLDDLLRDFKWPEPIRKGGWKEDERRNAEFDPLSA